MRISSTDVIEGGRVLYAIGKIKAATAWHAANGAPPQDNWRELVLSELIRRAEDIDADAIIGLDYQTWGNRWEQCLQGLIRIGEAGAAAPRRCHGHHEWLDQKSSARANGIQGEQP
jgi:hypothetical protein